MRLLCKCVCFVFLLFVPYPVAHELSDPWNVLQMVGHDHESKLEMFIVIKQLKTFHIENVLLKEYALS